MLNLSLTELKLIAKNRKINGYRSMSKDDLLDIINKNQYQQKKRRKGENETERVFLNQKEK